jgi:hypothetical protein
VAAVTLANGAKLSPRVLALVEDAAGASIIAPGQCIVTKGSFVPRDAVSGDTHAGDGAGDIRVWNLTTQQQLTLVNELRKRNCAAWLRDATHGGFAPHIHFIAKDQPGLSAGAKWQVSEYDKGRDGLSDGKPDYHPRPQQTPFRVVKWTAVTRWPKTGVYAAPDPTSARKGTRLFGAPVSYVDVVTGTDGGRWLRNAAGNYVAAAATAARV